MPSSKSFFAKDPVQLAVQEIADLVMDGHAVLADFQRSAVWRKKKEKQLSLFKSLLLGIPTGVLYLWEIDKNTDHPHREFSGLEQFYRKSKIKYLVLDGQQRMTTIASLYASIDNPELMDKVVFDLKKNQKTEQPFRFVKEGYELDGHEVFLQNIIGEGASDEADRIAEYDPNLTKFLVQAKEAFSDRQIAIQHIQKHANKADALNIFGTVNQEGVVLSDTDHIQAILTSIWSDFHNRIYKLEESLQTIQISEDKDGKAVYGKKLTRFQRELLIKAVMWRLYSTTQRSSSVIKKGLTVYDPTLPDKSELTEKNVEDVFNEVDKGARAFKKLLVDELYLDHMGGHSANSVLGGILFYVSKPNPDDKDRGKLLAWYLLSSYYLHWSGGSTDDLVDATCKSITDSAGVQWDDLWNAIRNNPNGDHKHRYENIGNLNRFEDLLPKIGFDQFPGHQQKTGKLQEGIWKLLIRRTLPCQLDMQDWFTGERLNSLQKDQYSIHHIFPQSKFETNKLTELLINDKITYEKLAKSAKQKTGWHMTEKKLLQLINQASIQLSDDITEAKGETKNLENEIDTLSDFESEDEDELKENSRLISRKRKELRKLKNNLKKLTQHNSKVDAIIQKSKLKNNLPLKSIESCLEFWYRYSNDIEEAKHHPSNLVVIKKNTNSALGGKMLPANYLKRYQHYSNRIEKQFISLKDFSFFNTDNYHNFLNERLETILQSVNQFLQALYDGKLGSFGTEQKEITLSEQVAEESEYIEFKETAIFDVRRNEATWVNHPKRPYLMSAIARAVVSFTNGPGGLVLVGVNDKGVSVGLHRDLNHIKQRYPNENPREKLKHLLQDQISNCGGKNFFKDHVTISPTKELGEEILIITVKGSSKPVKQKKYFKTKLLEDGSLEVITEKDVLWARSGVETIKWDPTQDEEE